MRSSVYRRKLRGLRQRLYDENPNCNKCGKKMNLSFKSYNRDNIDLDRAVFLRENDGTINKLICLSCSFELNKIQKAKSIIRHICKLIKSLLR